MNLGEWLQLASWDVKAFFGDKDAASHAAALREVNAQATPEDREIFTTVESAKIEYGGFLGTVRGLGKSIGQGIDGLIKTVGFVFRFLPVIVIVAFLLYLIFYVKIFNLKKVSA